MTSARRIVASWSALSADELGEQVRAHVRVTDGSTRAVWAAVRDDQVLRARVRGALSGLKAEFRGHRDEAMWLLWITRVQQQITPEPKAATAAEVVSDRADDAWASALDAPGAADAGADAVWDAAVQTSDGAAGTEQVAETRAWTTAFEVPAAEVVVAEQPAAPTKPRPQVPMVVFQTPAG